MALRTSLPILRAATSTCHFSNSKVRPDQSEFSNIGEIAVINQDGDWISRIEVPNYPELTSLAFSQIDSSTMMAIDKSRHTTIIEFEVKESVIDKSEKDKASQYMA